MQITHDRMREQERLRQEQIYHQEQQHRQRQPDITITKKSQKDDGDYIDYEEVKWSGIERATMK